MTFAMPVGRSCGNGSERVPDTTRTTNLREDDRFACFDTIETAMNCFCRDHHSTSRAYYNLYEIKYRYTEMLRGESRKTPTTEHSSNEMRIA